MNDQTHVTIDRRVFRFGTSHAVTIPAWLKPEPGEQITVTINKKETSV